MFHRSREIKDEVVSDAVCNFHALLPGVSFSWRENDIHLLVCEMVLKEFLIFEAISSARNHADIQCLNQYLHSHDRMGVCAV